MAYFTSEQAEDLAEQGVRAGTLAQFDFASGSKRLWNGHGALEAGGYTWDGTSGLGSIDGMEETRGPVSQQITLTLSGATAEMLALVTAETADIQGRLFVAYLQLFDADWQNVGNPIPIWFGVMQPPRIAKTAATEEEGPQRTITLPVENLFFGRSRPAAGRYTDRDQKTRFPGDKSCEQVAALVNKTLTWPNY